MSSGLWTALLAWAGALLLTTTFFAGARRLNGPDEPEERA